MFHMWYQGYISFIYKEIGFYTRLIYPILRNKERLHHSLKKLTQCISTFWFKNIKYKYKMKEIFEIINEKLNFDISEEQQEIIENLLNKQNCVVQAVAGAGKTTLVLELGLISKAKILHLTYNRDLAEENNKKVEKLKLSGYINSCTLHAFATKIAGQNVNNDEKLKNLLSKEWIIHDTYDYLVIDELQDFSLDMMLFIYKLYYNLPIKPTILAIGDKKQTIYAYKGSSSIYLKHFNVFFSLKCKFFNLKTSFRLPYTLTKELNNTFFKEELIKSFHPQKTEQNNLLSIIPTGDDATKIMIEKVIGYIKEKINNDGAKIDDFFIGVFSLKNAFIKELELAFVNNFFNVYKPYEESDAISNKKEIKGKIVISTIHQLKGRERKYVILPFFDVESYTGWLKTKEEIFSIKTNIPNLHYVALTRATRQNFIIIRERNDKKASSLLFPYINKQGFKEWETYNNEFAKLLYETNISFKEDTLDLTYNLMLDPTTAAKHLEISTVNTISSLINQISTVRRISIDSLNIKDMIFFQGKTYQSGITLLNSFYLTQEYIFSKFPKLFEKNLNKYLRLIKSHIRKIYKNYSVVITFRKIISKQIEELGVFKWYEHASNSMKLQFFCLYLAFLTENYNLVQIPFFSWLDDFSDLHKVIKFFDFFNIEEPLLQNFFLFENKNEMNFMFNVYKDDSIYKLSLNVTKGWQLNTNLFKTEGRVDILVKDFLMQLTGNMDDIKIESKVETLIYFYLINCAKDLLHKSSKLPLDTFIDIFKIFKTNFYNVWYTSKPTDKKIRRIRKWSGTYVKEIKKLIKEDAKIDSYVDYIDIIESKNINKLHFTINMLLLTKYKSLWSDVFAFRQMKIKKNKKHTIFLDQKLYSKNLNSNNVKNEIIEWDNLKKSNAWIFNGNIMKKAYLLNYATSEFMEFEFNKDIIKKIINVIVENKIKNLDQENLITSLMKFIEEGNKLRIFTKSNLNDLDRSLTYLQKKWRNKNVKFKDEEK